MKYCKITGNRLRTAAEDAEHWTKSNDALRVRLAGMPTSEAAALCHKIIAAEYQGWSAKAVARAFLANEKK